MLLLASASQNPLGLLEYILAGLITLAIGAAAGVYRTRKTAQIDAEKIRAEAIAQARSSQLEELRAAVQTYKDLYKEARGEINELRERVTALEKEREMLLDLLDRRRKDSPIRGPGKRRSDPLHPEGD